jgi:hypothetical protein
MAAPDAEEFDVTWWLSPVAVTDDGPRLERAHGDWVWPQAQGRLGAALQQIGANGRYELIGLLNRGGQAYLWAARDHAANDALVVIKTVNPRSGDPVDSARLTREARLLELLAGEPTVISILDWGPGRLRGLDHGEFETDRPWLVLPYRAHLSLDRALALSGWRLSADATWQIGLDLGTALQHLHRAQVVHRDLSLRNVLLTPTGCVLADLGMAWAASMVDQNVEQRFTTGITNQSRGVTWGWLAPEAARPPREGRRPDRDPAADIFGWGLHVFAAATGRHPWAASGLQPNEDELYAMYDQGTDASLAGLDRSDLPESFRQLVVAALSTEPKARPTATELLDDLGPRPSVQEATAQAQLATAEAVAAARGQMAAAGGVAAAGGTAAYGGTAAAGAIPLRGYAGPDASEPAAAGVGSRLVDRAGRRTRWVAGVHAMVLLLGLVGLGGYQASRSAEASEQARAAAAAFPVAMDMQAALYAEATFPASGSDADLNKGRKKTDDLVADLKANLAGLKDAETSPSQPAMSVALSELLPDLAGLRALVDRLGAQGWRDGESPPDEVAMVQRQMISAATTMVNQAHALTLRIADVMDDQAADRAARNQVAVARAAAQAGVATAQLEVLGLAVINGQRSMNEDSFATMTELVQQQWLQLETAESNADKNVRPLVLAWANTDGSFRAWINEMQDALNNPETALGDPQAYNEFMDERLAAVRDLAAAATEQYGERAKDAWQSDQVRMLVILAVGVLLLVLIGLAFWRRARYVPGGSSHSGGETAAITSQDADRQRVPVGAGDV